MQLLLLQLETFLHCGLDFPDGDRSVHCTYVNHRFAFLAVQMDQAGHGSGAMEFQNEGKIFIERLFRDRLVLFSEGHALPVLTFIPAKVQNIERLAVLDTEKAFAGNMDTPSTEIASDPAPAKFFGDGKGSTGATEEICDKVVWPAEPFNDTCQKLASSAESVGEFSLFQYEDEPEGGR